MATFNTCGTTAHRSKYLLLIALLAALIVLLAGGAKHHDHAHTTLILDLPSPNDSTPHAFRSCPAESHLAHGTSPSHVGLKSLKASGSAQFSAVGLTAIKARIPAREITIVDLRQESHGFLEGLPVSWWGKNNAANKGLNTREVEEEENDHLHQLRHKGATDAKVVHHEHKSSLELSTRGAMNEAQLAHELGLGYRRFAVTDEHRPTNETVDEFVSFARHLGPDHWLHFHCMAGHGRTTTFLVMYDCMKNAKQVSLADIVRRQEQLGGVNVLAVEHHGKVEHHLQDRANFVRQFYEYCRENNDHYRTSWTDWLARRR